jgi:DNA-binding NtrC family response regulator/tetratricopeptide (TPR) repeat protein
MRDLTAVRDLQRRGRFSDALKLLDSLHERRTAPIETSVLRAELLERTGCYPESESLARQVLASRLLRPADRSTCELVLGLTAWDAGRTTEAIGHLQRAVSLAQEAGDLERLCWSELRLMIALAGTGGMPATDRLLARVRASAVRLGEPTVTSALHMFVGELEAKQGLIQNAQRHIRLGLRLLALHPNLWIEAMAENTLAATAIMLSDYPQGLVHAENVRRLSLESGAAAMHRASLGNLGNLHTLTGDLDTAIEFFRQAARLLPAGGEHANAGLDGLARALLHKGEIDRAEGCLADIERSITSPGDRLLYANRYARLTKGELLIRTLRWGEAAVAIDEALELAGQAGDRRLVSLALARRAEILARSGRPGPATEVLGSLARSLYGRTPEIYASYERSMGHLARIAGPAGADAMHFERSRRVFDGLGIRSEQLEIERALAEVPSRGAVPDDTAHQATGATVVQSIATLILHPGRPDVLARTFLSLVADMSCAQGAEAVIRTETGEEPLARWGTMTPKVATIAVTIGRARQGTVDVRVQPAADAASHATVNSLLLILDAVRDIERAQIERAERTTLWPLDEPEVEGEDAIVMGKMQGVMALARKIAATNVSVLITGESGTGKELVARTIHRSSARAHKPFVPFNCTAVPRDLLESQVFGYRRGAFTGADRDNPGLIRTARDGTLFLDEVGELGLDLQPKLLRFLESGEIHPLGEHSPFTVNVRIVAATNAVLEEMVRDGRFREDLFYRLNVVTIVVPPLRERRNEIPALVHHFVARAAAEFSRGRVRVSEDAMEHLLLYSWPGNVRQLQNELRRVVALLETDGLVEPGMLTPAIRNEAAGVVEAGEGMDLAVPLSNKLGPTISRIEREMIRNALRTHGHVDAAARALGISRKGLYLKRQRLGV